MPKEYTHWWLAREALLRVKASKDEDVARRLAPLLERNRSLFYLGAVGPDFLFYYLFGPEIQAFRKAGMDLHGSNGADTLKILGQRAATWKAGVPETELAFLYGFACHVAADVAFHPLVLHYVGRGTAKTQYDHHVFEAVLDLYVRETLMPGDAVPSTLRSLTRSMETSREAFLEFLGFLTFGGGSYDREALKKCLRRYEFIQAWFWSPLGKFTARLAGRLFPSLRNFEPSFYQKRFYRMTKAFAAPLPYRHPVTGEPRTASVETLRDEMTKQAEEYAGVFAKLLRPGSQAVGLEAQSILGRLRGANLETGIFGDTAANIRYTAEGGIAPLFGEGYAAYNSREKRG